MSSSVGNYERSTAFSVGFWLKVNSTTVEGYIISKKNSSDIGWGIYLNNSNLYFSLKNIGGEIRVRTTNSLSSDVWYRALVMYDGSEDASGVNFRLNASLQSKTSELDTLGAGQTTQNSENLIIGQNPHLYSYFEGFVDQLQLHSVEVGSSEGVSTYNVQDDPESIISSISSEKDGDTYKATWEHQCTSVDTDKYAYNLSVYAFSNDSENFNIQMWNTTSSAWGDVLGTQITSSTTWINQTIVTGYVASTITWRYVSASDTYDYNPSLLSVDYAGVTAWNFSINFIETTLTLATDYKTGVDVNVSIDENPLNASISSGVSYKIQIRGIDGVGNPVSNNYLFYDNDSSVAGALQLTTSWTDLFTVRSGNIEEILNFWLWLDVPFGVNDVTLTVTVDIRIVEI